MKALLRNFSLSFVALLCSLFIMSSGLAFAAGSPSYSGVQCSGAAAASPVCHAPTSDPLTGSNGILVKATNIIALVAGVAAVIMIIVAGIKFITSQGDSGSVGEARKTIIYACVGLAVIVLAKTIITYVVSKV
jgi:hypothetical protein